MTDEQLKAMAQELALFQMNTLKTLDEMKKATESVVAQIAKLAADVEVLRLARQKQIELNTQFLNWKAEPKHNESPSSWWKRILR